MSTLPRRVRRAARACHGDTRRLENVVRRLLRGEAVSIVALGGSVTGERLQRVSPECSRRHMPTVPRACIALRLPIRAVAIAPATLYLQDSQATHQTLAEQRSQRKSLRSMTHNGCLTAACMPAAGAGTHSAPDGRYLDRLFDWVNSTFPHSGPPVQERRPRRSVIRCTQHQWWVATTSSCTGSTQLMQPLMLFAIQRPNV